MLPRRLLSVIAFALFSSWISSATAQSFRCPEPVQQVTTEIKGDLNGQAQTLIKLGTADLKGHFETTVVDLLSKYQNSDRVAIAQNLLSTACQFLRNSNEPNKFDKWLVIIPLITEYFPPQKSENAPDPLATSKLASQINLNQQEDYIHQLLGHPAYVWTRPRPNPHHDLTNSNSEIYILPHYTQFTITFGDDKRVVGFSVYSSSEELSKEDLEGNCVVGCKSFDRYGYNTYFHALSSKFWYYGEEDCRSAYSGSSFYRCEAYFIDFTKTLSDKEDPPQSLSQGHNRIPTTLDWNQWRHRVRPGGYAAYYRRATGNDGDADDDYMSIIFHDYTWILAIGGGPGVKWQ